MQYVYLLTNNHVPRLVKFGFSRREPNLRAAELSAPTGVPGKWKVEHFWEVEDGYGVEQEVFFHLSDKRLGRQEFFEMDAAEAISRISAVIRHVGTNPTQRAKEDAERAQKEALQRAAEKKASREKVHIIQRTINEKIHPVEEATENYKKFTRLLYTIIFSFVGFGISESFDKNLLVSVPICIGIGWLFLNIPFVSARLLREEKEDMVKLEKFRLHTRNHVLATHGLSEHGYIELLRKAEIGSYKPLPVVEKPWENIDDIIFDSQSEYKESGGRTDHHAKSP